MEVDLVSSLGKNHNLTSYEKALDLLFGLVKFIKLEEETLPLKDSLGKVLFSEVAALIDNPPNDVSSMDGYAVKLGREPLNRILKVIDLAAAGKPSKATVTPSETIRIFTGAKLPSGTNSVIIQEEVNSIEGNRIELKHQSKLVLNDNVRLRGCDFIKGTKIKPGEIISPKEIMLFAAMGYKSLQVRKSPMISIISIGDELTPPGTTRKQDQIYSSNAYGISALLRKFSCKTTILPIAHDNLQSIQLSLMEALKISDMIVTSGGASVGDYDLVKAAAEELGGNLYFDKVNIRPGKPTFAGYLNNVPLLGLPGNPVSSYVCAQLFLIPFIMKVNGCQSKLPETFTAKLINDLKPNGSRKHFMRGNLTNDQGEMVVFAKEKQDSSLIKTLKESNCLIVRQPNDIARSKNDLVKIIKLN